MRKVEESVWFQQHTTLCRGFPRGEPPSPPKKGQVINLLLITCVELQALDTNSSPSCKTLQVNRFTAEVKSIHTYQSVCGVALQKNI